MAKVRGDFGQRGQDEVALKHARVRDLQVRLLDRAVGVKKDVEVDEAGAFGERLVAAHVGFDLAEGGEEFVGRKTGFGTESGIEEPGLVEVVDGLGFVEARDSFDADGMAVEELDGFAEVVGSVANVGAKGDVHGGHWEYFRAEEWRAVGRRRYGSV